MQDKYAGDIGDYVKLGLLRYLIHERELKLGVAWYRMDMDESGRGKADGQKVEYLKNTEQYREVETELFDHLRCVVCSGNRKIESLEPMLPRAKFYRDCVPTLGPPTHRRESRKKWFERAMKCLSGCDLVFADPDNGLIDDQDERKGCKEFCKQIPFRKFASWFGDVAE